VKARARSSPTLADGVLLALQGEHAPEEIRDGCPDDGVSPPNFPELVLFYYFHDVLRPPGGRGREAAEGLGQGKLLGRYP
jgi:hypothetical protein